MLLKSSVEASLITRSRFVYSYRCIYLLHYQYFQTFLASSVSWVMQHCSSASRKMVVSFNEWIYSRWTSHDCMAEVVMLFVVGSKLCYKSYSDSDITYAVKCTYLVTASQCFNFSHQPSKWGVEKRRNAVGKRKVTTVETAKRQPTIFFLNWGRVRAGSWSRSSVIFDHLLSSYITFDHHAKVLRSFAHESSGRRMRQSHWTRQRFHVQGRIRMWWAVEVLFALFGNLER